MRKLIVWGERDFTIEVPDDARVTFGPWSPIVAGSGKSFGSERGGTLRIYKGTKTTENVVAVFAGVAGFRDVSLDYEEVVAPPLPTIVNRDYVQWDDLDEGEKEDVAKRLAAAMMDNTLSAEEEKEEDDIGPDSPF